MQRPQGIRMQQERMRLALDNILVTTDFAPPTFRLSRWRPTAMHFRWHRNIRRGSRCCTSWRGPRLSFSRGNRRQQSLSISGWGSWFQMRLGYGVGLHLRWSSVGPRNAFCRSPGKLRPILLC
jgi:hypothetical protein